MRYRILIIILCLTLLLSACGRAGDDQDLANRVATMMAEANLATLQTTSEPSPPTQTPAPDHSDAANQRPGAGRAHHHHRVPGNRAWQGNHHLGCQRGIPLRV